MNVNIKKHEHPEYGYRILDPDQLVPGLKYKRVHCLKCVLEYVVEFSGTPYKNDSGWWIPSINKGGKIVYSLADMGVIPYGYSGHYNTSNFIVPLVITSDMLETFVR